MINQAFMNTMLTITKWFVFVIFLLVVLALVLVNVIPGYGMYAVKSDSMQPAFGAGDLIICAPPKSALGGQIEIGSVVIFNTPSGLVTHRVFSSDFFSVVTKGDANNAPDPYTVAMTDIKGMYLFNIPKLGYFANFIQTKTGWFVCILVPTFLLVVWIVIEILKEAFKKAEAPDTNRNADGFGRALRKGE